MRRTTVHRLLAVVLCAVVLAGCATGDGSGEGAPDAQVTPAGQATVTPTERADAGAGSTGSTAESPSAALGLAWEPLEGPPGGNTFLFAQDDFRPENLYAATGRGLYHSIDQGDSWRLLDASRSAGVTSLAFAESAAYGCGQAGVLALTPPGAPPEIIGDPCYTLAATGSTVFASNSSEAFGEPRFQLERLDLDASPSGWVDITPPEDLWRDLLDEATDLEVTFVAVEDVVVSEGRLLALVAVSPGPFAFDHLASRLLASDDAGDTWRDVSPPFEPPLVTQRVVSERHGGTIVALAHQNRVDGPFFPLADMGQVSTDGGRSWQPLTSIRDIVAPTISDVEVLDDRFVLTNVDFSMVELGRGAGGELIDRRAMPQVAGYSFSFALDELVYDLSDPNVIYGRGYLGWEGVVRLRDGGATWQRLTGGIVAPPVANLTAHPQDPNVLIAGGNLGYLPHVTRDGGATWQPLVGSSNMADEVTFDPHDTDHLLMTSERSVMLESVDGGRSWNSTAVEFSGTRVHDVALSADGDTLYSSNLGTNVTAMRDVLPGDDRPRGEGEDFWQNLLGSPDYSYALAPGPDGTLLASYSPKKFESHAGVWRYDPAGGDRPEAWSEVLRVGDASGITDLAPAPSDPATIYGGVVGKNAAIVVTDDGGTSWDATHGDEFGFVTVHAVAIDPTDHDVIYAAPWGAGLFESVDGGGSWREMQVPTVSVASILVDPGEPGHLWLGDRTRPVVWETWDGGETWESLIEFDDAVHYRVMSMLAGPDGLYVSLLDRGETGVNVFAGAPISGSTFRVGTAGPVPVEGLTTALLSMAAEGEAIFGIGHIRGVYEIVDGRAIDLTAGLPDIGFNNLLVGQGTILLAGGADVDLDLQSRIGDADVVHNIYRQGSSGQWQPLLEGDPFASGVKQIVAHPADATVMYAATGTGLYVSVDNGATWRPENDGLAFRDIGSLAIGGGRIVAGLLGGGVAVGEIRPDRSIAWAAPTGPEPEIANIRIVVDPADPDRLWASSYPGGVFRSDDRGVTWSEANFGIPSFEVSDPLLQGYYSLAVDPSRADTLYLSVFEHGVFESADGARTWRPIGNYGRDRELMTAELTQVAVDPIDTDRLWLTTADKGVYVSPDRGLTWVERNDGLSTSEVVTIHLTDAGQAIVGTAGYGLYLLEPGETTWQHLGSSIGIGEWQAWDRRLYQYSSFLFDPAMPDRVYLGQFPGGFFVSEDGGSSWRSSNVGIGNDGIFSLTAHPERPDVLFAGSYNGILRSDDAGATWRDTSAGMPAEQWPFSVVIDDQQPEVMYTATKNGQNKGFCDRNHETFCGVVMKSTDGGATWSRAMEGLDDLAEYYMLVIDPRDHDVLYVSSSRGVYMSTDAAGHWTQVNHGLPELEEFFVRDNVAQNLRLSADGQSLFLAVVGYGVWRTDLGELPAP